MKQIKHYEHYLISQDGSIFNTKTNKCLTPFLNKGYYQVSLCKNGKPKIFALHRLLANAYILNPNNYDFINHKNGIKNDNNLNNLEWCTHSQNIQHAWDNGLIEHSQNKINKIKEKICVKLLDTNTGNVYESIKEASKSLGINYFTLYNSFRKDRKNNTSLKII